jgi:hypothetical protein
MWLAGAIEQGTWKKEGMMAVDERPTHGCMTCHARQPYTVEPFANGNTGWRCVVCSHILKLIPGTYTGRSDGQPQTEEKNHG